MIWSLSLVFVALYQISQADCSPDVVETIRDPGLQHSEESEKRKSAQDGHRKVLFDRLKRLEESKRTNPTEIRAHDAPLTEEDRAWLVEIAKAVERFKRDPFSDVSDAESVKKTVTSEKSESHSDSDLREKESDSGDDQELEEGFIAEDHDHGHRKLKEKETHVQVEEVTDEIHAPRKIAEELEERPIVRAKVEEATDESHASRQITEETEESPSVLAKGEGYCDKYEQHFSFYCIGDIDHTGEHEETISKFCPAYKAACAHKKIASTVSLTAWPEDSPQKKDPFRTPIEEKEDLQESSDESSEEGELDSVEEEAERKEAYLKEIKRRFPCKPDCDSRIFPHCTEECKCDYLYPAVQRFCNPPPLPIFLNTCRLWYNGCPRYAQYHYASQYIYSKAEKGKKLPGISNPNPYNIPTGVTSPPVPHVPIQFAAAGHRREQTYPDKPQRLLPIARASTTLAIPPPLPDHAGDVVVKRNPRTRTEKGRKTIRRRNRRKSQRKTSYRAMSTRDLYRLLRAVNGLTSSPVGIENDPASLRGGHQGQSDGSQTRPRAAQVPIVPVVPSDAVLSTDNTFRKFDGLTDSSGVLHRPRSRSPFSKPGLWEPNPDNPHNRDHANKFYYHPRSVGVDWLNGQIAWGAHWAVPAAGVGGTDGFSAVHFPTIGTFLNIPDDYD